MTSFVAGDLVFATNAPDLNAPHFDLQGNPILYPQTIPLSFTGLVLGQHLTFKTNAGVEAGSFVPIWILSTGQRLWLNTGGIRLSLCERADPEIATGSSEIPTTAL